MIQRERKLDTRMFTKSSLKFGHVHTHTHTHTHTENCDPHVFWEVSLFINGSMLQNDKMV